MRKSRIATLIVGPVLFLLCVAVGNVSGHPSGSLQTETATISGVVTDPSGAVLPRVTVVITHVKTRVSRTITTNDAGVYSAPFLPVGHYTVQAELTGFKKGIFSDLELRVDQKLRVDIQLQPGNLTETVEVIARSEQLIKRDSSELGQEIVPEAIANLPLNQRDLSQLPQLSVGVGPASEGEIGGIGNFHANGQRSHNNNLLVDGANLTNVHDNAAMFTPPVEAVEEFKLDNSNYSAEFGRAAGAIVNLAIKRGTNDFHGSLFWFWRNRVLDARSPFDLDPQNFRDVDGDGRFNPAVDKFKAPPFNFNQFGGTIGGPIVRNKTFFFADYQGTLIRQATTFITSVPTEAMRRGDFRGLPRIYHPFSGTPINPSVDNRPPFPNNQIPLDRMDPAAVAYIKLLPLPNLDQGASSVLGINNLGVPGKVDADDHKFDVRIDHHLTRNDALFGRFSFQDNFREQPGVFGQAGGPPLLAAIWDLRSTQTVLGGTHILSPTVINDFRFSYSTQDALISPTVGDRKVAEEIGIANANLIAGGFPLMLLLGYASDVFKNFWGDSLAVPTLIRGRIIQFGDTLAMTRGKHSIKTGFQAMRRELTTRQIQFPRGFFIFSAFQTASALDPAGPFGSGHPVASFLIGAPFVIQRQSLDSPRTQFGWEFGAFVQDDIKLTPRLTLNLGLRYDYYQPFVEKEDRQADLDPTTVTMRIAGSGQIPRGIFEASKKSFQPRLGFAYSLSKNGKTVLRGGYAISSFNEYNSTLSVSGRAYQNPPFFFNTSVANGLFGGGPPRFTLSGGPPVPQPVDPNNPTGEIFDFPPELENAYVQSWNLNLQRALPGDMLVDAAYTGAKGTHLAGIRNINQTLPNPAIPGSEFGGPARVSPRLGLIQHYSGWANSIYHALQFKVQKRFSRGLWFLASYTYSHSIDDQSNGVFPNNATLVRPQDSFNAKADRAHSTFDIRNRFVFSYIYEFPVGRGRRFLKKMPAGFDHILGGWGLTGILTLQDGSHFTPTISVNNPSGIQLRPNRVGDGNLPAGERSVNRWFDLSAFTLPARDANGNFFRFGNAGRNILVTPGFNSLDFGLQKKFSLYEGVKLEFRADFFNLLNHPNFGVPNTAVDAPTGGRITTIRGTPRQIQLGLRLTF